MWSLLQFEGLFGCCPTFSPYNMYFTREILMPMEYQEPKAESAEGVGFVKGCPVCEHADPQLERELQEFAQLLFDIMLAEQKSRDEADLRSDIDKKC